MVPRHSRHSRVWCDEHSQGMFSGNLVVQRHWLVRTTYTAIVNEVTRTRARGTIGTEAAEVTSWDGIRTCVVRKQWNLLFEVLMQVSPSNASWQGSVLGVGDLAADIKVGTAKVIEASCSRVGWM